MQALASVGPCASPRRFDFPWTAALVALAVVATLVHQAQPALTDWLVADERIATGQLWRLVTGPLLHATPGHLVRDCALVALVGVAYEAPLARGYRWFVIAALAVPTWAVLATSDARWYCGLSGVSHACFAAALVFEARQRCGGVRRFVIGLGLVFAAKPLYELVTGAPVFPMELGAQVRQVPAAHLAGVVVGVVFGLLQRRRR